MDSACSFIEVLHGCTQRHKSIFFYSQTKLWIPDSVRDSFPGVSPLSLAMTAGEGVWQHSHHPSQSASSLHYFLTLAGSFKNKQTKNTQLEKSFSQLAGLAHPASSNASRIS